MRPEDPPPRRAPPVVVLVAARDEERDVGACLRSILAQDYADLRVVLADDGSTDGTRGIAQSMADRDRRLEVIVAGDLPEGWVGKPHALHRAWRHAAPPRGTLLLFTDADVIFERGAVRAAVGAMERTGADLLSLLPRMVNRGFWEKVLQPLVINLIALAGIAGSFGRRERQIQLGAGAFLLVRVGAYRSVGGHRAVRDQIVEDVALATNVHRRGMRAEAMAAPELLAVRMYRGLGEIRRGWAKNLFAGHRDRLSWAACTAALLLVSSVLPPALAVACGLLGMPVPAVAFACLTLLAVVYRAAVNAAMGERLWPALLHALGTAVLLAILAQSVWQRRFGKGAAWRGRRYPSPIRPAGPG